MSAIELITEYPKLKKQIHLLEVQIEEKRELAEALNGWPEGDRVQSSHEADKIGRAVAALADKELELIDLKLNLIDRMCEIEEILRKLSVDYPMYALVLQYRYIKDPDDPDNPKDRFRQLTWEEIAKKLHYDVRWLIELNNRALRAMDEII